MSIHCNIKAFVRKYGREPDRCYKQECKEWRKISNRAHRKECNQTIRAGTDWDAMALPPSPTTSGWLTT